MEEQESTSEPSRKSDENNNPILQDEFTAAVVHWLRHWWDAPREKAKWTDVALVLLTITIAIAAFWSAYVFVGQLEEARKQTAVVERQMHIGQRAWMVSAGATFTQFQVGKIIKVRVDIKNNGPSPAIDATLQGLENHWTFQQPAPPPNFFGDKPAAWNGTGIMVRSTGGMAGVWDIVPLTTTIKKQLHAGQFHIRVDGKVFYDDIFGHHHWVTFCGEYVEEVSGFAACETGHQMDTDPE